MNLPPDKVRLLRSYDNEKKWELICDQVGGVIIILIIRIIINMFQNLGDIQMCLVEMGF